MSILVPGFVLRPRKTVRHTRMPSDLQAMEICKAFSHALDKIYPGYAWQVGMMQDVVHIQNLSINKELSYQMPLAKFDPEGKLLMRIGGEILERFNVKRGKMDRAEFKGLERDIKHNAIQV